MEYKVEVLKTKKGVPTVILVNGMRYIRANEYVHGKEKKKENAKKA